MLFIIGIGIGKGSCFFFWFWSKYLIVWIIFLLYFWRISFKMLWYWFGNVLISKLSGFGWSFLFVFGFLDVCGIFVCSCEILEFLWCVFLLSFFLGDWSCVEFLVVGVKVFVLFLLFDVFFGLVFIWILLIIVGLDLMDCFFCEIVVFLDVVGDSCWLIFLFENWNYLFVN